MDILKNSGYLPEDAEIENGDEQMDVEKDLYGDGSGMYRPDFCCILPKGLNTLLVIVKSIIEKVKQLRMYLRWE